MQLTSKAHYTLRSIIDLALHSKNQKPIKLYDISQRQSISLFYLEQLFRKLRMANIVFSVRGPGGGYLFKKLLKEISIKDILDAVGENVSPSQKKTEEIVKNGTMEQRITQMYFQKLDFLTREYFTKTTLHNLVSTASAKNSQTLSL